MKTKITYLLIVGAVVLTVLNIAKYMNNNNFESAKNDPTNARVYTLENGLKVYLTTYKDAPIAPLGNEAIQEINHIFDWA